MDNAEYNKYYNQLNGRVKLLRLECENLELMIHIDELEVIHRERFPELYKTKLEKIKTDEGSQSSENKTPNDGEIKEDNDRIAERSNKSE